METVILSKPQYEIIRSRSARNLFFSGQGGGKTFVIGILSGMFVIHLPEQIGLIAANTYGQLSDSTLTETKKVWEKIYGWTEYDPKGNPNGNYCINKYPPVTWTQHHPKFDSPHHKIYFKNGCVIFTASLDNYKALDGRTIGWALLDETKDTKEAAVKSVILGRLRQKGIYKAPGSDGFGFTDKMLNEDGSKNEPINPLFVFTTPYKELWLLMYFKLLDHKH